ncbi:MAG TPA: hypothetical protein VGN08_10075 [Solirubrobacteraceae bacterium]|jgi:hypothetical protein
MSITVIPLASGFLTGSILSLVLPIAVVIAVTVWYVLLWHRGTGER